MRIDKKLKLLLVLRAVSLVVVFVSAQRQQVQQPSGGISSSFKNLLASTSSSPSSSKDPAYDFVHFPTNGPIDDATCNIEDLEKANDSQLYTILHDLKQTSFFRTFVVDLNRKCPLRSWRQSYGQLKSNGDDGGDHGHQHKKEDDDDEMNKQRPESLDHSSSRDEEDEEEEDVVECSGGKDELDEDAEPLCTVHVGGDDTGGFDFGASSDPFGGGSSIGSSKSQQHSSMAPTPSSALDSNALSSFSEKGFEYKSQQNTFAWTKHKDLVESDEALTKQIHDANCGGSSMLPDEFWIDICGPNNTDAQDHIDEKNVVNLVLNPERNTGYNGTHIWKAIYEENCLALRQASADHGNDGMCFEERVLYRMLSGLHASTTVSIAVHYYPPSKRKGRTDWEASPHYFMQRFQDNPEYIRNLHFSYVVLLRALSKAAPFLHGYEIRTGNIVEDETATVLLRRLLDSRILGSCSSVFEAFDESLMFQEDLTASGESNVISLQQSFKGVFHNISSILDCVQCQQCKLHGKMAMLGYGAALKVLFMQSPVLERNEIVALVNTIAKFSESIRHVREMTHMYWETNRPLNSESSSNAYIHDIESSPSIANAKTQQSNNAPSSPIVTHQQQSSTFASDEAVLSLQAVNKAVEMAAKLGHDGLIKYTEEEALIKLAFEKRPELLILANNYQHDSAKFWKLVQSILVSGGSSIITAGGSVDVTRTSLDDTLPDAVIVGTGLAGLSAALNILDRGGTVVLIEKEHLLGGNSNKASSGINGCCLKEDNTTDTIELFRSDTLRSAGSSAQPHLVDTLVQNSADAVTWLKTRAGVDLSLLAQLGGHSAKRTHRPNNGMAGAEIIYAMQKAVRKFEKLGKLTLLLDTRVTGLLADEKGEKVTGVKYVSLKDVGNTRGGNSVETELLAHNVILATGGFAADRSTGSFLEKYRPELLKMPTTAGEFSTGDGIALASSLGAGTVDMDKVQLHPTGWIDPKDPDNKSKVLAAELMRGVGGILINDKGYRFCNELGTRAYVTDKMLSHNSKYTKTGKWDPAATPPSFHLILSSSAAEDGRKHVELYTHKGFLTKVTGVSQLAKTIGLRKSTIMSTMRQYQEAADAGKDEFGKTEFRGVPQTDLESEVFYVGKVTPVLHYCMGGITIDPEGSVLREDGTPILGLHAAGEVTGGVHGVNRLGGNSLLECTVYGTIVGRKIPVKASSSTTAFTSSSPATDEVTETESEMRVVSLEELQKHDSPDDCWVAIHDVVYDLTEFAEEHPAGAMSIHVLAGKNGTEAFAAVHNIGILEDFDDERIGILKVQSSDSSCSSNLCGVVTEEVGLFS